MYEFHLYFHNIHFQGYIIGKFLGNGTIKKIVCHRKFDFVDELKLTNSIKIGVQQILLKTLYILSCVMKFLLSCVFANSFNEWKVYNQSVLFFLVGFGVIFFTSSRAVGHFCRFRRTELISYPKQSRNWRGIRRNEANN